RPVRALGHRQQSLAVPGAAPDPPGRTAAHRPESRPTGVAPALADDPAEPAPPPELRRRLLLRPAADRPASEAAELPRVGADPGRRGGLLGAAAGPLPGLHLLGALPGQSATDRGESSAGGLARRPPGGGRFAGRPAGLRPLRLPHACTLRRPRQAAPLPV